MNIRSDLCAMEYLKKVVPYTLSGFIPVYTMRVSLIPMMAEILISFLYILMQHYFAYYCDNCFVFFFLNPNISIKSLSLHYLVVFSLQILFYLNLIPKNMC